MLDQPVPHARSATLAGGSARSRRSIGSMAGSHSRPSLARYLARFHSARPSGSQPSGGGALAGAEGVDDVRQGSGVACHLDRFVRREGDVVGVGEHGHVLLTDRVAAFERLCGRVVHGQQPRRRLLLEPLADEPLVGARTLRELGRRRRAVLGEGAIEAEPLADVDGVEVERGHRAAKQSLAQRIHMTPRDGPLTRRSAGRMRALRRRLRASRNRWSASVRARG